MSTVRAFSERRAPREISELLRSSNETASELISSSVVLLYGRYPSVRTKFEAFVGYLEPYYHPSNGGDKPALERLLGCLVDGFIERLAEERCDTDSFCFQAYVLDNLQKVKKSVKLKVRR